MRSLDKKQPAEDNLSLEPWVLGGRVDLLDGGRGHVCMHFTQFYRCVLPSRLSRFVCVVLLPPYSTLVTTVSHTPNSHSVSDQNFAFLSLGRGFEIRSVSDRLSASGVSRSVLF